MFAVTSAWRGAGAGHRDDLAIDIFVLRVGPRSRRRYCSGVTRVIGGDAIALKMDLTVATLAGAAARVRLPLLTMSGERGESAGNLPVRSEPSRNKSEPQLVPKGVAWSMGAGLLGLVIGGAVVGFTAAVVAPAVRERLRRRREDRTAGNT